MPIKKWGKIEGLSQYMDFVMSKKIANMSIDMNTVRVLCKINENKGKQCLYKKQPKSVVSNCLEKAIEEFVFDTYIEDFNIDNNSKLRDLIRNIITPTSREDIGVLEFRDVIKTINTAYEDMEISSQTILQLHGYLHRYSVTRGGRYRSSCLDKSENDNLAINNNIEQKVEELCKRYNELIKDDEIEPLVIIAIFIMDFIRIKPFEDDNTKMYKILTLLLLNKNGYEVGRFTSLGNIYDNNSKIYFKTLYLKNSLDSEYYNINKWLSYILGIILNSYESLSKDLKITIDKKETKTKRIEKVINSTLGYFTKDDIKLQCPDIPEPTINRVFDNLRRDGKIEVIAKGRSAKWKKK